MNLTPYEKETVIIFNEQEDVAEITTYNEDLKRQLKELEGEDVKFKRSLDCGAVTYIVPKYVFLKIRLKKRRNVTEEERRKRSERMKMVRTLK